MSAPTKTLIVGRGRDCDLLLTHSSISRRHAELTLSGDGSAAIRDMESMGGVFLVRDGKETQVTQTSLKPTDSLRLGDYNISVKDLLSLIPEEEPVAQGRRIPDTGGFPPKREGAPAKTRMMRCACGSIKERGKICPDCGA